MQASKCSQCYNKDLLITNTGLQAYGFKADMTESEIVAELMKMYRDLTE